MNIIKFACLSYASIFVPFQNVALAALPDTLFSPDNGIVCNGAYKTCYDRFGPSIGITEIFFGHDAAIQLNTTLRSKPTQGDINNTFSPKQHISCIVKTGPCKVNGSVHKELTALLFKESFLDINTHDSANWLMGVTWEWLRSDYSEEASLKPLDSAQYTILFTTNGLLNAKVDCNRAGGKYQLKRHTLNIQITHSTMAVCESASLAEAFLKNLADAEVFYLHEDKLFLKLKNDIGIMQFKK